jgi:trimethylamine---corrinoid protein Co-methyltransferase
MRVNQTKVLSDSEIGIIHNQSLEVLRDTGVRVMNRATIDLLAAAGAQADNVSRIVKVPEEFTRKYLSELPETIRIWNRGQTGFITLGDGKVHCASGHNAIHTQEFGSDAIRDATKQDVGEFAFVTDALENLEVAGIVVMPRDVPEKASLVHAVDAMFNYTTKHVFFSPGTEEETAAILDIARAVTEKADLSEKPVLTCQISPTSPLTWETGAVRALELAVRSGVPVSFLPGPMGGAACPYTLAGHLIQYNAEMLSGIVISQVVKRGAPVIYGGGWSIFDMKESIAKIASPESVLLRIAGVQMARHYRIPCHSMGLDSDSHTYDEQQGAEKLFTTMGDYLVGADLVVNGGMYSSGVTASLEQLVIDDEISGILRRFMQGIDFDEDKWGMDAIREAGPGGEFLSSDHTMKYLRSGEHRLNELSLRLPLRKWNGTGRPDIVSSARGRVKAIMAEHRVPPLGSAVKSEIARIIKRYETKYVR